MLRQFGIEIEGVTPLSQEQILTALVEAGLAARIHGRTLSSTASNEWLITTDGSIQDLPDNKSKGDEIVSPIIRTNTDWRETIKTVCRALKKAEMDVNKYCALHVHASVEHLDEQEKKDLFDVYKHIEPELNKMFPRSRTHNDHRNGQSYCKSIKDLSWEDFSNPDLQRADKRSETDTKYYSLRMCTNVPTFEFRIHQGTINAGKIIKWITIIQRIFSYTLSEMFIFAPIPPVEHVMKAVLGDLAPYYESRVDKFKSKGGLK